MSRASLADVLQPALQGRYAVAGMVVLGWEDARAYVEAAEAEGASVVLQAGPACRCHTPLPVLGAMLGHLATEATVPVVVHLDHGRSVEECRTAIDCGFTSVMYDGSAEPFDVNCEQTRRVVEQARAAGVSVEGEIGVVGRAGQGGCVVTSAAQAERFAAETGVDALAVSVGNVHFQTERQAEIDLQALRQIEAATDTPLVLHGVSGIPLETRRLLARETNVCKLNVGTELRMCFGEALRDVMRREPEWFDRVTLLKATEEPLRLLARRVIRDMSGYRGQGDHDDS